MSLDMERKSLGVKHLLRRLRGVSPRPLSPEDQLQDLLQPEEGAEKEAETGSTTPGGRQGRGNPLLPRG